MNENLKKLNRCFCEALGISEEQVTNDLAYQSVREWDSVGHMALVTEIEASFDIMLDTDNIIAMSSVGVAKEILRKHGVEI
jgi:acyl carrier protein